MSTPHFTDRDREILHLWTLTNIPIKSTILRPNLVYWDQLKRMSGRCDNSPRRATERSVPVKPHSIPTLVIPTTPDEEEIPYGYCHCGCGEKTTIAKNSRMKLGWRKGEPLRFLYKHHTRKPNYLPIIVPEYGIAAIPILRKGLPGLFALVDIADMDKVWLHQWHVKFRGGNVYVQGVVYPSRIKSLMHRVVLGATSDDPDIDHVRGCGLDNRRINLRFCSDSQNQANRKKWSGGTSKFKGVSWAKNSHKWHACIKIMGKTHHLGFFELEVDAARAYNNAARSHFGEFALPNVIEGEDVI